MKDKKLFAFTTRTIVATGIGAAIFMLLFMFVKIPSPVPETSFQTAYGVAGFFAALFGPIAGALIAFIGHALSDLISGYPWWSWIIASGVCGFGYGIAYKFLKVEEGVFNGKSILIFNVIQILSNAVAWIVVAPVLDILIYAEPLEKLFVQAGWAAAMNSVTCGVIGTVLLWLYSMTRTRKGSLRKKDS